MPKAKRKKSTEFNSNPIKSAFLYGRPEPKNLETLVYLQAEYTAAMAEDVELLTATDQYLVPLMKGSKHDPDLRALEKKHRRESLGCVMSQGAFDGAVDKLANRLKDIKTELWKTKNDIFTQSDVLCAMALQGKDKPDMIAAFQQIIDNKLNDPKVKKPNVKFYQDGITYMESLSDEAFKARITQMREQYSEIQTWYKIPSIGKQEVLLTDKAFSIEKVNRDTAEYIAYITNPAERGNRIPVPVKTSSYSEQRLSSLQAASSISFTVQDDGIVKISWAFSKEVIKPETSTTRGVDTGITDCLYASDGNHYGSMSEALTYYFKVVEPSYGGLSDLRNKIAKIDRFLGEDRDYPLKDGIIWQNLDKRQRLQKMLDTAKAPQRKMNRYDAMVDKQIADSVHQFVAETPADSLTVLEKLDIKEFNKDRKTNGRRSTFSRGKMQKRLMEELNWAGKDFIEVEPAYTSQLCPVCSHVEKDNRKGKVFKCKCCGYTDDADYVASININARLMDQEILDLCDKYHSNDVLHPKMKAVYKQRNDEWKVRNNWPEPVSK